MYTKEQILTLLDSRDSAVNRAVLALFDRQTADEQAVGKTLKHNSIGFNAVDANLMSYYARWIRTKGGLSGAHLAKARKRVRKYARQLAAIANERSTLRDVAPVIAQERQQGREYAAAENAAANYQGTW